MYTSGKTTNEQLLPAGPSRGSPELALEDVGLKDIVVDNPSNDPQESEFPVKVPKPRPLNLADTYEIVGGIPTFVWKASDDYNPTCQVYAISTDGTRMAIREGWHKLCVYDVLDNFSLVATWEDTNYATIEGFTFHNDRNNELVVVFHDSTVVLMSLSPHLNDATELSKISAQNIGTLEVKHELRILSEIESLTCFYFHISNHRAETWVCGWDVSTKGMFTICSIKQEKFRRLQIKSGLEIIPKLVYCCIPQRAIVLMSMHDDDSKRLRMRTWTNLDFNDEINIESPMEICDCLGFGFDAHGSCFWKWNCKATKENEIELYFSLDQVARKQLRVKRFIGRGVKIVRVTFIETNQSVLEELGCNHADYPVMALMVATSNQVTLSFSDLPSDFTLREIDVTMKQMTFSDQFHVDFCLSSDIKWIAVGCHSDGIFGVFSMLSKSLIWSTKLNCSNNLYRTFVPLQFDPSSTRLIINTCIALYVLAPTFLIEDDELEFRSTSIGLGLNSRDRRPHLSDYFQALLPKHILKKAFALHHGSPKQDFVEEFDMASSRSTSNIALLIRRPEQIDIVQGSFETLFSSSFKKYIKSNWSKQVQPIGVVQMSVDTPSSQTAQPLPSQQSLWIFFYPNGNKYDESIVVFLVQDGMLGIFINTNSTKHQDQIPFGDQECFALKQSTDRIRVACLHAWGVMIIDLLERTIVCQVTYKANLSERIAPYIALRNESCFNVSQDGTSITIDWNANDMKRFVITSSTEREEYKAMFGDDFSAIPCWHIDETNATVVFFNSEDKNGSISTIYLSNSKAKGLTIITGEQWNNHTRRILESLTFGGIYDLTVQLDERNGHIWIIVLHLKYFEPQLVFVPITPYSFKECIPSLYSLDYPEHDQIEIEELALKFGHAFFMMTFEGKSNLQLALDNKDKDMMAKLIDHANSLGISFHHLVVQNLGQTISKDLLKGFINSDNEAGVAFFFDMLEKRFLSFEKEASMLKDDFTGLWMKYGALMEKAITNHSLERIICTVEVPIGVLSNKVNIKERFGTCDSITPWDEAYEQRNATKYWKSKHKNYIREVKRGKSESTVSANVTFFTISNSCKIGLKGILRDLLMQGAPSYIFKAPLLKWVITFKWETVWKKRSLYSFILYACFTILYSIYSIWIACYGKDLDKDVATSVCSTIILFVLMCIALRLLCQEYVQMKTYIEDGGKLFPNDGMWGLRKYWSSPWNVIEVISYLILIIIVPIFHFTNLGGVDEVLLVLHAIVALETLLLWIKVWYFAQAFDKTGAFVLMIENIVKDCFPFLALAFTILVGFSSCLFVLFQHPLHEKKEDDEVKSDIDQCFGNPAKAMVTLFYAMIGTFEPKLYYHSGSMFPFITFIFVAYLATQMIVMINMLIAIMGDTFDRVKSTEEQQLLMGRARFIDACEAQLNKKEIEEIENSIETYLYVLFPKEGNIAKDMGLWQGRVKTIEEQVGKMIKNLQDGIIKKLENDKKEVMNGNLTEIMEVKEDTRGLKQMRKDMDDIKEIILAMKEKAVA